MPNLYYHQTSKKLQSDRFQSILTIEAFYDVYRFLTATALARSCHLGWSASEISRSRCGM